MALLPAPSFHCRHKQTAIHGYFPPTFWILSCKTYLWSRGMKFDWNPFLFTIRQRGKWSTVYISFMHRRESNASFSSPRAVNFRNGKEEVRSFFFYPKGVAANADSRTAWKVNECMREFLFFFFWSSWHIDGRRVCVAPSEFPYYSPIFAVHHFHGSLREREYSQ